MDDISNNLRYLDSARSVIISGEALLPCVRGYHDRESHVRDEQLHGGHRDRELRDDLHDDRGEKV